MLYNGQEIGSTNHPYKRGALFKKDDTIRSQDKYGLFNYYQQLATIRTEYKSLHIGQFKEIPSANAEAVVAFRRWKEDQNIIVLINMSDKPAIAELDLSNFLRTSGNQLSFKDLLANKNINIKNTENGLVKITIDGYTTKYY